MLPRVLIFPLSLKNELLTLKHEFPYFLFNLWALSHHRRTEPGSLSGCRRNGHQCFSSGCSSSAQLSRLQTTVAFVGQHAIGQPGISLEHLFSSGYGGCLGRSFSSDSQTM